MTYNNISALVLLYLVVLSCTASCDNSTQRQARQQQQRYDIIMRGENAAGRTRAPMATDMAFVSLRIAADVSRHCRTPAAGTRRPPVATRPPAKTSISSCSRVRKAGPALCGTRTHDHDAKTTERSIVNSRRQSAADDDDNDDYDREAPCPRRQMLEQTAANTAIFASFLGLASALGLGVAVAAPASVGVVYALEGSLEEYSSPDGTFALWYPATFKAFSKPLKTHKLEVNFKSEEIRGYEVGVAVDPVKIESLEKFGTPDEIGARVMRVEREKDGTLDTKLFGATAEKQGDLSLYTLDYFVESTRGFKHFVAKVAIKDNLLYACTGQAKESDYPQVEEELKNMVKSFRVPA